MRTLIFLAAALACGCATAPEYAPRAQIGAGVILALPLPPGYPERRTLFQSARASYREREAAFDAVVALSPEQVEIIVTAAGGPRLATINWSSQGIREERTLMAPTGVPVENILADIFVSLWPIEDLEKALPANCELSVAPDGGRVIACGGVTIMEVQPDMTNPGTTLVRNLALGYELTIVSRNLD